MDPIDYNFLLLKQEENIFDIILFSDHIVLNAFKQVFDVEYVENSIFDNKSIVVFPNFPNYQRAELWKQYWINAFSDPDKSCQTCPDVIRLFELIEEGRNELKSRQRLKNLR